MSDAKQLAIAALSTIAAGILGIGITVVAYKNQDKIKRWIFRADNTSEDTKVDNSGIKQEGASSSDSNLMRTNNNQSVDQTYQEVRQSQFLNRPVLNQPGSNKSDDDNIDEMQRSLTTSMDSPIAFPNFSADTSNGEKKAALLNIINKMKLPNYGKGIRGLCAASKQLQYPLWASVTPTANKNWDGLLFNKENCEAIIDASGKLEINQGHCCVDLGKVPKAYISGDYHGNINAAIEDIKEFLGDPDPDSVFIVTGDFTDRHKGYHDLAALLLSLQLYLPDRVILLEGNHEQRDCHVRRQQDTSEVPSIEGRFFDTSPLYPNRGTFALRLPLYCTLEVGDKKILCCHGAPAPQLIDRTYTLDGLKNQTYEQLKDKLVYDTCWRDLEGGIDRGTGLAPLAYNDLKTFLEDHKIDMLVRGHQHRVEYKDLGDNKAAITLLSSPDYFSNGNTGGTVVVGTKDDGTGEASLRFHYANGNTEMIPLSGLNQKVMDVRQLDGLTNYQNPLEGPPTSD